MNPWEINGNSGNYVRGAGNQNANYYQYEDPSKKNVS
jgi:hypothetical protein